MKHLRAPILVVCGFFLLIMGALAGCSSGDDESISIPDSSGAFHFMAPATWQHNESNGMITLYAADSLPSNEAEAKKAIATAPSFVVLTTQVVSTTPVPDELVSLIDARAEAREWESKEVADPVKTKLGNREAYYADVTGVDANGGSFKGRFYLARAAQREVFIAAIGSPTAWSEFAKQINTITQEWYWQLPDEEGSGTEDSMERNDTSAQ